MILLYVRWPPRTIGWREAGHLQAIEGNPLTAEESAMFGTFERMGWSPERRRARIARRIRDGGRVGAAK